MDETKAVIAKPSETPAVSEQKMLSDAGLDQSSLQTINHAKWLSKSKMIPKYFQDNPQDVFLVLQFAGRAGLDPMTALQGIDIIQGKPTVSAKLAITIANQSKAFDGKIHFEVKGEGDAMAVRAYAKTHQGEVVDATASMRMAKAEGWTSKPGSKYSSMPEQMLCYRAAKFLISRYAPEILFGFTPVEPGETWDVTRGAPERVSSRLQERISIAAAEKSNVDDKR